MSTRRWLQHLSFHNLISSADVVEFVAHVSRRFRIVVRVEIIVRINSLILLIHIMASLRLRLRRNPRRRIIRITAQICLLVTNNLVVKRQLFQLMSLGLVKVNIGTFWISWRLESLTLSRILYRLAYWMLGRS